MKINRDWVLAFFLLPFFLIAAVAWTLILLNKIQPDAEYPVPLAVESDFNYPASRALVEHMCSDICPRICED